MNIYLWSLSGYIEWFSLFLVSNAFCLKTIRLMLACLCDRVSVFAECKRPHLFDATKDRRTVNWKTCCKNKV